MIRVRDAGVSFLPGRPTFDDHQLQPRMATPAHAPQNALPWKLRKADMPTPKLTTEIIAAAIDGYEVQKTRIDAKIAELRAMLPGGSTQTAATPEPTKRKRRKMSAAGRKAIADAQRKRWAASKKAAAPSAPEAAPKKKRKLSRAGRAAIVAASRY
jgi:hypothetical protein